MRSEPEAVRLALARRGAAESLDEVMELDRLRRELLPALEGLRAEQNAASKEIGAAKQRGADAAPAIAAMEQVAARGRELSDQESAVKAQLDRALSALPNLPDPAAPDQDTVLREVGEAGRTGRDHLELAGELIDMESAARVSGSRFAYLKGDLVLVELALVRFALETRARRGL